jgi:hypothetical protein
MVVMGGQRPAATSGSSARAAGQVLFTAGRAVADNRVSPGTNLPGRKLFMPRKPGPKKMQVHIEDVPWKPQTIHVQTTTRLLRPPETIRVRITESVWPPPPPAEPKK